MKHLKKKIAVVSGSRAEYGLLYWLLKALREDDTLELQLIATCMHLSPEFGLTYRLIEQDGFEITAKVEMLLSSDSALGISKSVGLGVIGFADAFERLKPDLLIVLGDRFEILAASQAALLARIPIAHIHGGELTEGALDDSIRHAITKMACLHFPAAEPYRKRIIQMGESPDRVFNFGAPGLERIGKTKLLDKIALEERLHFSLGDLSFLVTYHPTTLDLAANTGELAGIFSALDAYPEAKIIFTKANADEAGRLINHEIDKYVAKNSAKATAFVTMGDLNFLSSLQFVSVVIGNSSSGLIEAPAFHTPTINIGSRQEGRLRSASVLDCSGDSQAIIDAIATAIHPRFRSSIKEQPPAYRRDDTAEKILSTIKQCDLSKFRRKSFFDLI